MKKIAIFNDYQLPLPSVKGGSVPTLTTMLLKENEKVHKYDIDVYSCFDKEAKIESQTYKHSRFFFSRQAKLIRFLTNLTFKTKIPFVNLKQLPLPYSAKKQLKSNKYDVVYINGYIRGALSIINQTDAAIIIHHHVVTDLINEPTLNGNKIVDKADTLCFVSDFAVKKAKTGTTEQNDKIIVFPNAIYTEKFHFDNLEEIKTKIRKKYNISNTDTVILFVGRMVENKGCLELLQAFNNANFDNSVKLMVVGGATYSSKKVTPYVQKCIDEAKINRNVILTGYIPYNDLPQYYAAADISTLISRCDEACGLVGIESMAAGLPIITTDRGGIGEYVANSCKIVVEDDDNIVQSVEHALNKLVNDSTLRQKMGQEGKKTSKKYTRDIYFKTFCDIIEKTLQK